MDEKHDLESLMGHLGDFGKYQGMQFTLHVLSAITAGVHMLSLVTVAAVPDHRCFVPGLDTNETYYNTNHSFLIPRSLPQTADRCNIYENGTTLECTSWVYDTQYYKSSRGMEWNFVCDRRWMGAVAQSIYMFGVFTGAVFLGRAADKYGRKIIFYISAVLQLVLGVAVAFTNEYYSFLFLRYLYGIFGSAGSYIPGFVLTMELVGPSRRSVCGIAFQAAFAVGIMLVAGWGALIKDRQLLQVVYGLHSLVLIGHWWIMDESPRWLWGNGKPLEAVRIVKKGLKINGSAVVVDEAAYVAKANVESRVNTESAGVLDLFKTYYLRKKTLNMCLCWFANSLVYYGLSLNTGKLSGNPFFMLFCMGLVEMPSYILTIYLMDKWGRRLVTALFMVLGSVCCIIAASLFPGTSVSTGIVMVGKFFISGSFAVVYNYSAELFPTVIRNSAIGIGAMCARTSGALTPLITLLDSFDASLPSIIFAIIALLSGLLVLFLPETLGSPMPQSMEDGERFGIGDTFFRNWGRPRRRENGVVDKAEVNAQEMQNLNVER